MWKNLYNNPTFTKVIKSKILVLTATIVILSTSTIYATAFELSFTGTVDDSEAEIGGVPAPIGSTFTLNVGIETTATIGTYDISLSATPRRSVRMTPLPTGQRMEV